MAAARPARIGRPAGAEFSGPRVCGPRVSCTTRAARLFGARALRGGTFAAPQAARAERRAGAGFRGDFGGADGAGGQGRGRPAGGIAGGGAGRARAAQTGAGDRAGGRGSGPARRLRGLGIRGRSRVGKRRLRGRRLGSVHYGGSAGSGLIAQGMPALHRWLQVMLWPLRPPPPPVAGPETDGDRRLGQAE
ncbi:hypothetical protein RSP03_40510 [Cereibacter sphaeroides]|nr:hypothetical protein RSP03_40510 [Cereibacter sphaeroides]